MSLFNNAIIGASGQGGYRISRSVRLRQSASAYFNRTPASAGNRTTWTWSGWAKLGSGLLLYPLDAGAGTGIGVDVERIQFGTGNGLYWQRAIIQTSTTYQLQSSAVFRDPSAWYHLVLVWDSSNATSTERMRAYVNGARLTTSAYTAPSQNQNSLVNASTPHKINTNDDTSTSYGDGYLTEVNFIDGQALTPSSFGETNSQTGIWQPKRYAGTYGTNGFYLNFSDNSAATATTMGKDYSGNGNNWTPNNISVTAGVTYDSMLDVPTLYADGGNGRGNYCVLNPLNNTGTTASANLNWNGTDKAILSTIAFPTTGKYYFEATCSTVANFSIIGIANSAIYASAFNGVISSANFRTYNSGGEKADSTRTASWGSTFTNNDIIGVAVDMDNGAIYFAKNNTWQASGVPTSGASKTGAAFTDLTSSGLTWTPFFGATNINGVWIANFGQRPFTYTPPTGFVALNTQNLPTPTISNGATVMAATLYQADGANSKTINNAVNGVSMQPDLVWIKSRSNAESHVLWDALRSNNQLGSNTTAAEAAMGQLTSLNSNGFTVGYGAGQVNFSTYTYVGWQWKAGGTTSSNTSGSITSTVSVNATAGFSVVTYTGTGVAATIGHGLGVAPSMMIIKSRPTASTSWIVYHSSISPTNLLTLQTTAAQQNLPLYFNSTAPTSSVFSIGSAANTGVDLNVNGSTYVAYCFAAVAGYSAFGSYTGNGSTDGPFVYLGFRPRWLMIKRSSSASVTYGWQMYDTSRQPVNTASSDPNLWADTSAAEGTGNYTFDLLSNGFKLRSSGVNENASGNTYIYAAFAENPFKLSLAR
jgi:hypothetical protein